MDLYLVEGRIVVNISIEIEADSIEDSILKTVTLFKEDNPLTYYMSSIDLDYLESDIID